MIMIAKALRPVPPTLNDKHARESVLRCKKHHCACTAQRHLLRILPWRVPGADRRAGPLCRAPARGPL